MNSIKLSQWINLDNKSINPNKYKDIIFDVYSLPSYDQNKYPEKKIGREIKSINNLLSSDTILFNKLNVRFKRIRNIYEVNKNSLCSGEFLRLRPNKCNQDYLYYFLQTEALTNYLIGASGGSSGSHSRISPKDLIELKVNFPDLISQQKIASVLSSLDAKIELNNKISTELKTMVKSLYDYWFVQFDFPDGNGKPYKSSGGAMVYSNKLKRMIPKGWEVRRLDNYINFKRGISYTQKDISEAKGVPLINLNSFNLSGEYKSEGLKMYSGKFKNDILMNVGDLVIAITDVTRSADIIGRAFMIPNGFADCKPLISCDVANVIIQEPLTPAYVEMLFNSQHYHDYIKYFATGTLVLHLNLDGINRYNTFIPPKELIDYFSSIKNDILKQVTLNQLENQRLTELRDFLLPMLMNGQVVVE